MPKRAAALGSQSPVNLLSWVCQPIPETRRETSGRSVQVFRSLPDADANPADAGHLQSTGDHHAPDHLDRRSAGSCAARTALLYSAANRSATCTPRPVAMYRRGRSVLALIGPAQNTGTRESLHLLLHKRPSRPVGPFLRPPLSVSTLPCAQRQPAGGTEC